MRLPNLKIRNIKITRKRLTVSCIITLGLIVLFSSYAIVVPAYQAKSYKKNMVQNQSELDGMITDAGSFLYSDTYLKPGVDADQAKKDIQDGRDLVDSAENQLNSVTNKLLDFKPAPGLGWTSKYKSAKQIKTDEQQYIVNARVYFKEVRATIDYTESTLELQEATLNAAAQMAQAIQSSNRTEAINYVNEATAQLQTAADKYARLKTTKSTKAMHDFTVSSLKTRVVYLKELSNAISTGNPDTIIAAYNKLADLTNEAVDKESDIAAEGYRNSPINDAGAKLDSLEQKILVEVSKL